MHGTSSFHKAQERADDQTLRRKSRRRQFIPQDVTPEAALTWQTYRDRAGLLQQWRLARL
jgi:hypothetical protein